MYFVPSTEKGHEGQLINLLSMVNQCISEPAAAVQKLDSAPQRINHYPWMECRDLFSYQCRVTALRFIQVLSKYYQTLSSYTVGSDLSNG